MAHKIVQNWSTEAIGKLVADEFAGGETHVFLHDVSKFPKESESVVYNSAVEEADNKKSYYEENDRPRYGRRYVRNASMLEICEKLAVFETYYSENGETNRIEPLAGLRVAGPRGVVTSAYEPALHTEGAAEQHPPRMISYWDAQPENGKGDKIHILSTTDVLEWSMRSLENRMMLRELEQPQNFTEGGLWRAPIYDK